MDVTKKMIYKEVDGLLYPQLKMNESNNKPLGRYGRMKKHYLKENRPDKYNYMLLSDTLMTYLHQVNEEAWEQMEIIQAQLEKKQPFKKEWNDWQKYQHRQKLYDIAEEIVVADLFAD